MAFATARKELVYWIKEQLLGDFDTNSSNTLNGISPLIRFPVGVLFPIDRNGEGLDPAQNDYIEDDDGAESVKEDPDAKIAEPVNRRRYVPPSSVGFSFYIPTSDWKIQLLFSAIKYQYKEIFTEDKTGRRHNEQGQYVGIDSSTYTPILLGGDIEALTVHKEGFYEIFLSDAYPTSPNNIHNTGRKTPDKTALAGLDVRTYPYNNGVIVTVSLVNKQAIDTGAQSDKWRWQQIEKALFNVSLSCLVEKGEVGDYPSVDYDLLSAEDQEIELQYAHKKVYAVGHGSAVQWRLENDKVVEIFSDFMPIEEVPQVTADVANASLLQVLSMQFLATTDKDTSQVCVALTSFIDEYSAWIIEQQHLLDGIEATHIAAAQRIIKRMQKARDRMLTGIQLIAQDSLVARAFALANQAMLSQMRQSRKIEGKNVEDVSYNWRPFQLAFMLTTLPSTVHQEDEYRDEVDLIWFPTGGGKTEAYLGLSAFLILYRRLKYPDSYGGTTALMRYTLRLLTTQQYARACRLICALELIRQHSKHPQLPYHELGEEMISIGLWVGSPTSPNTIKEANKAKEKAKLASPEDLSYFVITHCPWCHDKFTHKNLISTNISFYFSCKNAACDFGQHQHNKLPCNVVDEVLYQHPPTLLVATIDKFAGLAWDERMQSFFSVDGNRPPELIIQDELHLISSALGSIAGIYEAALDTILRSKNVRPKYIASTATIKEAQDQVKKLFGKPLSIFPPPGLSAEDSFFAKTVSTDVRPGRMYVGYYAPLLNRQKNLAPLAAILLAAPHMVFGKNNVDKAALLDAWWTQVIYHGSLKGVGNSHNCFNIVVKDFYDRLINEYRQSEQSNDDNSLPEDNYNNFINNSTPPHQAPNQQKNNPIINALESRRQVEIAQLTSNSSAQENATTFANLALGRDDENSVDAVLATNMISVGLDVSRLALMIINGQPLTTAEYIQASSRVGRSEVPGIVFINYYRDQARSLSHYENFRSYHQSFYRFVEPTSVTPYTYQARKRALHAGLVISLRHGLPKLLHNNDANNFDPSDSQTRDIIDKFAKRCCDADPQRSAAICEHIEKLANTWHSYQKTQEAEQRVLCYHAMDDSKTSLLYRHGEERKGLWMTLNSMRNVEHTGLIKIL